MANFEGHPTLLVIFICDHFPFSMHLKKDLVKFQNDYMSRELVLVAISPNYTITVPKDGLDFITEDARNFEYLFSYLCDETQSVTLA